MSAELVPIAGATGQSVVQQQADMHDRAVARLGEWAHAASAAYQVAQGLVETSFVPQQYRGKPHEATAAILAGAEVGLSPLAALRSFDNIGGTAAARALTLRAIVQSQGHEVLIDESTESRCKMRGRRRDSTSWVKVAWTLDRAKALGLVGKDNWKKQPGAMLVARATSELCRLVAADAILGIAYSAEEVADGGPIEDQPDVQPGEGKPATRRMSRPKVTPLTSAQPESAAAYSSPDPVTEAQLTKLHTAFTERGVTERDDRLAFVVTTINRDVESSKDLTKAEASLVIDSLESGQGDDTPDPRDSNDPWVNADAEAEARP